MYNALESQPKVANGLVHFVPSAGSGRPGGWFVACDGMSINDRCLLPVYDTACLQWMMLRVGGVLCILV